MVIKKLPVFIVFKGASAILDNGVPLFSRNSLFKTPFTLQKNERNFLVLHTPRAVKSGIIKKSNSTYKTTWIITNLRYLSDCTLSKLISKLSFEKLPSATQGPKSTCKSDKVKAII